MINKKGISLHPQSSNNDGAIAQLVEQRTENPCVPGSIPGGTTLNKQNPDFETKSGFCLLSVVPPGIEPGTQGFSVLCSTN